MLGHSLTYRRTTEEPGSAGSDDTAGTRRRQDNDGEHVPTEVANADTEQVLEAAVQAGGGASTVEGGTTESEDQDDPEAAFNVLSTLFSLAGKAVKAGGRLVFWYPSRAFVTEGEIRQELDMLMQSCDIGDGEQRSLRWRSATPEKMHDKLWRWLVVLDVP